MSQVILPVASATRLAVMRQDGRFRRQRITLTLQHRFLQPMDGSKRHANTRLYIDRCFARPGRKLSLQSERS